jgi:hypothetical protein
MMVKLNGDYMDNAALDSIHGNNGMGFALGRADETVSQMGSAIPTNRQHTIAI